MQNELIGVAGLGLLGRGIVACLLGHGFRVKAYTTGSDTHQKARVYIETAIDELLEHGVMDQTLGAVWRDNYTEVNDLSELSDCTFIIESVTEDRAIKEQVFEVLEAFVSSDTPIASNTSAIPISTLQSTCKHPERFLGMHWAEPAYATRFLELIRGEKTSEETIERALLLGQQTGKDPAIVNRDIPGFIVNRLGYAMYREALHLLETEVADVETIDRAFRNACGLWATFCGPFRWMDITGGPALYAKAMSGVLPNLSGTASIPDIMQRKLERNERGVKGGGGFYEYQLGDEDRWEKALHAHAWIVWDLQQRYANNGIDSVLNSAPRSLPTQLI